ncbi:adenosylcobinamide kinase /adenosylcobinamide-phosphate guanylyltransferase [Motilibacter rhizosphaerae]|uniref:Adenosylcobinamide kinase n=1 Tax=Motilibacter rhizosphaerae TaxID=598652 RepID=A0A4Q7NR98_9ACTN|nr:bifunctional adenosylcobinamide kinase/adenosylcobinamide-phosphate guanylyltransferase [Motilibacter rhizosphaerae]RZS89577.1 adenosylcobinamide kinase /adenosylcobinamide-phosphate guanylyltransferase [Motilibacter rhizosphaerae]
MDLLLAGTGGSRGWPEPGCPCASCAIAAAAPRAPFELLDAGTRVPCATTELAGGGALLALDAVAPTTAYAVVLLADADLGLLARLRTSGAVGPGTDVVAVGLTHRHRPEELARLADCGVRVVPDGARLQAAEPLPAAPRRTLVLGGARSGKSAEAERRLLGEPRVVYVATAAPRPGDAEWADRVSLHQQRRPAGWATVETLDLEPLLADADGAPLLVDCLSLWLTGVVDEAGAWEGEHLDRVEQRCADLVAAWRETRRRVVAVSSEVGSGVVPATRSGRLFRDLLGALNARVAAESERVVQVVAGRVSVL